LPSQGDPSGDIPEAVLDIDPQTHSGNGADTKGDFKIVPETETMRQSSGSSGGRYHLVKKGETLRVIARQFYGDETAWKRIYDANRSILKNPDQISPGVSLRIP
jgi:nucleoid-associated protein YgaU